MTLRGLFRLGRPANAVTALVVAVFIGGMVVPFVVDRETKTIVRAAPDSPGATVEFGGGSAEGVEAVGDGSIGSTGSSGSSSGPRSSAGGNAAGGQRGSSNEAPTNSDVGVSKSEIRIGILVVSLGAFAALGESSGLGEEDQRKAWKVMLDAENEAGGFGGRKLVPVYTTFDATDFSNDSPRQACVALGEDLNVFAATGVYFVNDPVNCVTERYRLPLLTVDTQPDEFFEKARGLLVTISPSFERGAQNLIWQAHELGALTNKKVGIFAYATPSDTNGVNVISQTVRDFGHEVARVSRITIDASQSASQAAVEVQAMKRAGVEVVVAAAAPAGFWFDEAERQNFRPRYLLWDAYTGCYDSANKKEQAGPNGGVQMKDAIAVCATNSGNRIPPVPPHAGEKRCADIARKGGLRSWEKNSPGDLLNVQSCSLTHILAEGIRGAGVNPTRSKWAAAIPGLKNLAVPNAPVNSGFPPGRSDYGNLVRAVRFDLDCGCYKPMTGWLPARY